MNMEIKNNFIASNENVMKHQLFSTKLERIQRRALEFILKSDDDYEVRICKLNLLSLEHRRFLFDVLFF